MSVCLVQTQTAQIARHCAPNIEVTELLVFNRNYFVYSLQVSAQSEFQVLLSRFRNDDGRAADGHCCESAPSSSPASSSSTGRCSEPCRTFFRVCLSHYQTLIPEEPTCTYGELPTNVIGGNSFDIPITTAFSFSSPPSSGAGVARSRNNFSSLATTVDNPIRFPLQFSWPVRNNVKSLCKRFVENCTTKSLFGFSILSTAELCFRSYT